MVVAVVMTPPNKSSCQDLEIATETVMDLDPVIPTATETALPTRTPTTTQEIVMDEVRIEIIITMAAPEEEAAVQIITIEVKVTVLIITTAVMATNIGAMTEIAIEKKSPLH